MKKEEVMTLGRKLMDEQGLEDFKLEWDNELEDWSGMENTAEKRIVLCGPFMLLNDDAEVKDTILHEIAHALCEKNHHQSFIEHEKDGGHSKEWMEIAASIGAKPQSFVSIDAKFPPPKYWIICRHCGNRMPRWSEIDTEFKHELLFGGFRCRKCGGRKIDIRENIDNELATNRDRGINN